MEGVAVLAGKRKLGKRTPSGRLSRAGRRPALDEHRLGVDARMRRYGLTEAEARDQRAATVVGRLRLLGERSERAGTIVVTGGDDGTGWLAVPGISARMYEAAVTALGAYEAMRRALKSPGAVTGQGEGGAAPETAAYAEWARRAIEAWEVVGFVVAGANAAPAGRRMSCWAALDLIVLRDEDMPHLVPDLKVALEALATHFNGPDVSRAAWAEWRARMRASA